MKQKFSKTASSMGERHWTMDFGDGYLQGYPGRRVKMNTLSEVINYPCFLSFQIKQLGKVLISLGLN